MKTPGFSSLIDSIPPSGIRRFFDLVLNSPDVISLGVGEPDFQTPWPIREEALYWLETQRVTYTSNRGLDSCRNSIANYMLDRFKAVYNPDTEILLTMGVSEAVDITLRTILNPGDEVILPEPTYVCYDPLIRLAGGKVVSVDTSSTSFIPEAKDIKKKITAKTKAIILCTPSNPTGMVIPQKQLEELVDLALKHNLWIISDEIYAELTYDTPFVSLGSIKRAKPITILMNGFSKAFAMTGWRLGFICAPEGLLSRALKIHQYSALCAPTLTQYAAIEALKQRKAVETMRKSYEQRRSYFVNNLNALGLPTLMPQGAFYCFPNVGALGFKSDDFAMQLLEKAKVAVVPGHVFGQGGEGFVRCCYATDFDLLKEAIKRIGLFLKS